MDTSPNGTADLGLALLESYLDFGGDEGPNTLPDSCTIVFSGTQVVITSSTDDDTSLMPVSSDADVALSLSEFLYDAGGLTELDVELAAAMDRLAEPG